MPHLLIEYPQDRISPQQLEALFESVYAGAVATGLFDESHICIRTIPLTYYRLSGKKESFIHVQCRIHAGRTEEQKRKLSEAVLAALREQELSVKSITVEVVEMERASYAKYTVE